MAKRKGQVQTEALDNFLQYKFYHDAYEELTDKDSRYFELFVPLEFCLVFCQTADMVKKSKAKPTALSRQLKHNLTLLYGEIPLTDEQRHFFYYKLLDWFENVRREDEQIDICCREIEKLQKNLDVAARQPAAAARQPPLERRFDFGGKVKPHLETLPNLKAQLRYLYQVRAEFEQADMLTRMIGEDGFDTPFLKKCDSEIQKLKLLLALEQSEMQGDGKDKKDKRDKGGTQYQNLLTIHYLLLYARANSHNTKKAKFASFLTGYGEESFRRQWSNIHQKANESGQIWEKDMQAVRGYFEALGLSEVVKLIDNDLDSEREKL